MSVLFADLAVVIDDGGIDFFARNGTLMNHANIEIAKELNGVTYDYTTQTMYISTIDQNSNIAIFNVLTEKNFTSTPLIKSKYRNPANLHNAKCEYNNI